MRLERLGTSHAGAILAGQDRALAREVFGCRWEPGELAEFLERAERWTTDGPLREFAARQIADGDPDADPTGDADSDADGGAVGDRGEIVGGGGLHLLGPGLERGQADTSYWVLAPHRRHGWGTAILRALRDAAGSDPRIRTLVLRIAPGNAASQHVARGAGARPTGRSERHPGDPSRSVERWELDLDLERDLDLEHGGRDGRDDQDGQDGRDDPTTLAR